MLDVVWFVLYLAVLAFFVLLLVRVVLDFVQMLARDWRPRGAVLVVAEVVYTVTDPPIKALRRVVPPLTVGQMRFDIAFTLVFVAAWIAMGVLAAL